MDDIREWISDNLRYILLGVALIVVIILAVTGIRAISHLGKGGSSSPKTETETETSASTDTIVDGDAASTSTLIQNDADVLTVMTSYYAAKTNKDLETLKKLDPSIDETEEKANLDSSYVESYSNIKTYSKQGPTEDSCVVYVCYDGKVQNIDTLVPSLTQFYLKKDAEGSYVITDPTGDQAAESFIEETRKSTEVQNLIDTVNKQCEDAKNSDPVLKEFMSKYGNSQDGEAETETEAQSEEPTEMIANDSCNVRSEPNTESDDNVIGGLYMGDTVTKIGETDDGWTEIDYNGQEAYVKSEFLSAADGSDLSDTSDNSENTEANADAEEDYFSPDYNAEAVPETEAAAEGSGEAA